MPVGLEAVDDLAERTQRHAGFAQARQDSLDVVHEDIGRADDQDATGLEPAPIVVEQVGGAVQGHDGLASPGSAADRGGATARGTNGLVLLLLDRRDNRVHGAVAGPAEARQQGALADDDEVFGCVVGVEQVVLDADDLVTGAPQDSAADDAGRIQGGRLIEDRGCRCTPVDDDHIAVLIAHANATDVAGLAAGEVEPAEDEAVVGRVERREALGGLEHHGIALDEAAFIADVAARKALRDERFGDFCRGSEAVVDVVDIGLLRGDLLLGKLLSARGGHPTPSDRLPNSQVYAVAVLFPAPTRSVNRAHLTLAATFALLAITLFSPE